MFCGHLEACRLAGVVQAAASGVCQAQQLLPAVCHCCSAPLRPSDATALLHGRRHDACVRYMGEHYGEAAEAVVRGLLAAAPPWTNEAGAESASTPVSQAQVVTAVRRHPGGAGLADIAIRKTLG